jgi:hypothetical protein
VDVVERAIGHGAKRKLLLVTAPSREQEKVLAVGNGLHGVHGQARRHFARQRVLDLEFVHGQREHYLGSEPVLESIIIGGRAVIRLSLVVPNLAVLADVGHEAGLRSPVGALAFDVEVLGGIRLLDPPLRPRPGGPEDDHFIEVVGNAERCSHVAFDHAIFGITVGRLQAVLGHWWGDRGRGGVRTFERGEFGASPLLHCCPNISPGSQFAVLTKRILRTRP